MLLAIRGRIGNRAVQVAGRAVKNGYMLVGAGVFFYLTFVLAAVTAGHVWWGWAVGGALVIVPGLVLAWLRFTPGGRRSLDSVIHSDLVGMLILWAALASCATAGFAALSTALYAQGIGSFEDAHPSLGEVMSRSYQSFTWHLLDAIPVLKIPETINWELLHPFTDHAQGGLILVYKVLVLVPLLYIMGLVVKRLLSDDQGGIVKDNRATELRPKQ